MRWQPLRWRLRFKSFILEPPGITSYRREERGKSDWGEKLSSDAVSAKSTTNSTGISKARMALLCCLEMGGETYSLSQHWSAIGCRRPRKGSPLWESQRSWADAVSTGGWPLLAAPPAAGRVCPSSLKGVLGGASQGPLHTIFKALLDYSWLHESVFAKMSINIKYLQIWAKQHTVLNFICEVIAISFWVSSPGTLSIHDVPYSHQHSLNPQSRDKTVPLGTLGPEAEITFLLSPSS